MDHEDELVTIEISPHDNKNMWNHYLRHISEKFQFCNYETENSAEILKCRVTSKLKFDNTIRHRLKWKTFLG